MMADLCQYLEWDSSFFGLRIARASRSRYEEDSFVRMLAHCNEDRIDCLYLLAESNDAQTVRLCQAHQFQFVDIRLTLDTNTDNQVQIRHDDIRPHLSDDIPELRAIARVSHQDSRFYYDPLFPRSLSDRLYETWIENSCNGYADQVLVATDKEKLVGYISCHIKGSMGQIGLLSVSGDAQGKGFGSKLIQAALGWFAENGAVEVLVVTQGRNVGAQRVYQKNGFLTKSVQLWYHRWF
jgi:dTDP-4-amino-4,6-dideoxy-D-galactose acyltransferase